MNKDIYLLNLIEQFKAATGTEKIDLESAEFISDFNSWLARNKVIGDDYLWLLERTGIDYDTKKCAEVGKGRFDSLVMPYETTIVTPYIDGIDRVKTDGQVINSMFEVTDMVPMIFEKDQIVPQTIIKPTQINTFMTHNPYNGVNINSWVGLHYNRNYNGIILGVFGSNTDKDKDSKISQLYKLRSLLEDAYVENELINNNHYCYVIATDIIAKTRKLQKTDK